MKITKQNLKSILIADIEGLDPVYVCWQDFTAKAGHIIFVCYGCAWSIYIPAMPENKGIVNFFIETVDEGSADYLYRKLIPQCLPGHKYKKYQEEWIFKILKAVSEGLKEYLKKEGAK